MEYWEVIKQRRIEKNLSIEQLIDLLNKERETHITIVEWEMLESGANMANVTNRRITTCTFSQACDILDLDEYAAMQGRLEDAKHYTTVEELESLEPGGSGTIEQRAVRLYVHGQISEGRVTELIDRSYGDMPKLVSTGCTCQGCREYLKRHTFLTTTINVCRHIKYPTEFVTTMVDGGGYIMGSFTKAHNFYNKAKAQEYADSFPGKLEAVTLFVEALLVTTEMFY